eukprot:c33570_g1_i1.p2 GENE.c33570_g1_i1~~c33570_g1_i1.p2  ORF type:complete len:251 (-),score=36.64 c33570_g1_i1:58-768(-)
MAAPDPCFACSKNIDTDVVNLKGVGRFHTRCFACSECKGALGESFQFRDNLLFCDRHFNERYGVKCAACSRFIGAKVLAAGDNKYHPECFVCVACSLPFDAAYVMSEGLPYHNNNCIERGPACAECRRSLSGTVSRVGSKRYHQDCFKCSVCKTLLGDTDFKTVEGALYCVPDYRLKTGRFCHGCSRYLDDSVVKALGKEWHPECFVCTTCRGQFPGGSFVVGDGKPYCNATCAGR